MERVLITGGAGFAGHHVVNYLLEKSDYDLLILDKLNYSSYGLTKLRYTKALESKRVKLFTVDLSQPLSVGVKRELGEINYILHLAAETHVDHSILEPERFIRANILGSHYMLEFARSMSDLKGFFYFSTDEVFGPAREGETFLEWDRYNSTNPYSATKAAAEELCLAYSNTYNIPVLVIHTMNLFGERQHPEKFIPLVINKVLRGEKVSIHANSSLTKAGSRFYTHCSNLADAVLFLMQSKISKRDKINIVGEREIDNLELAQKIADIIDKPLYYDLVNFHSSRPGHDLRYSLDGSKLAAMGWRHLNKLDHALEKTVKWFLNNPDWLYR